MENKKLLKKIAKLETVNDQMAAELSDLERLARALGFAEGIKTLKFAATEMLESEQNKKSRARKEDGTNQPPSN
ncbi:MAG: hypothetical protein HY861_05045 [Chlamydiia bacterium]|nr:hypothetical protein [Chlamydiia bacterium]